VRAGKMSLPQAEALADLIAAANESAVELALAKLDGAQNRLLSALAEDLRALATLGEAGIDFSDQDLDELGLPALRARASAILARIAELEASYSRGSRIQDGIRVAFVGLPNAGKSSFFNALLGEDRSIVSEIAGTTRDVVREKFTLRGDRTSVTLRLEDTAGLRASHDPVERMGVERSRRAASEADLIVLVVDGAAVDRQLPQLEAEWAGLGRPSDRTLGIVTKGDLPGARPAAAQGWMRERGILHSAVTSAATGEGVSEAARAMARFCERWVTHDAGEVVLTRLEHHRAAQDAAGHLARAISAEEIDLFAADVRHSLRALSPLIGETPPDDILGRIFSKFCIGK
jgi:tRNA modification GTPase